MLRFVLRNLTLLLLLSSAASRVRAADVGTLHLADLPAGAHVYVDGMAADVVSNTVKLSPGPHWLQIEALNDKGSIVAHQFAVQAETDKIKEVRVCLFPVALAPWWPYRRSVNESVFEYLPSPPGERGPEGEPGKAGESYIAWNGKPTDDAILQTLKEALRLRLQALEMKAEDAVEPGLPTRVRPYVFDSGRIRAVEPRGPAGSPGAQGVEGLPASAFAIEDAQGQELLAQAMQQLHFAQLEQALTANLRDSERFVAAFSSPLPRLRLLTPAWTTRMEKLREASRQAALAAPVFMGTLCPVGAMGMAGPHGPTGANGVVPKEAPKLRLKVERAQKLLELLKSDSELNARLQRLKTQADKTRRDMEANAQTSPLLSDNR